MEKMTAEKAMSYFMGGMNCAQLVFEYAAEKLGIEKEEALKIASAFGSGMGCANTCGSVTGALMAIGAKYGPCTLNDADANAKLAEKKAEFEKIFIEKNGSLICKEILNYDLTIPEEMEKIMAENLFLTKCAPAVISACEALDEIL